MRASTGTHRLMRSTVACGQRPNIALQCLRNPADDDLSTWLAPVQAGESSKKEAFA